MKREIVIIGVIAYGIICMIGCQPVAIASSFMLEQVGIQSEIGMGTVGNQRDYCHAYILIDGVAYEPRFIGLYRLDHINYTPFKVFTREEFVGEYGIFPYVEIFNFLKSKIMA